MDVSVAHGRSWRQLASHREWLGNETTRLLDFARAAAVPHGFGWLDAEGRPEPGRPVQLWITTRMTHVFALGHLLGHPGCGPLADHGLAAIREDFEDREHGGWFPEVTPDGPARTEKEAYPHSFVLLAAASAAMAGRPLAPALLEDAIAVVEERFWSEEEAGCREAWDRGWDEPEAYRGANANMHMIEAFLAVGEATGDTRWYHRALRAAARLIGEIARAHDWRIVEHFDAHWRPLADYNADDPRHPFRPFGITPGHGLEWSRLLLQTRAGLGGRPDWLLEAARGLFARAVQDGWAEAGGFAYTTDLDGKPAVPDRLHWPVTEAIGAAAVLHEETGEEFYERWYRTCWDFAGAYLIDRARGSWHAELDDALQPSERTWSGKPDVYHSLQATLIPRLPVSPSLAGALRDGLLA